MDQGQVTNMEDVIGQQRYLEWQDQAVCRETDPDAFFPEPRDRAYAVKKICQTCPVRGKCVEEALTNNEQYGIWGGILPDEQKTFKKLGFSWDNDGVDKWFVYRNGKRAKVRERYKQINDPSAYMN